MSVLFDASPGTVFASAAGLIVHFELLSAIPVVWAIPEKDEKYSSVFVLALPRGECQVMDKIIKEDFIRVKRCPCSHRVQLC